MTNRHKIGMVLNRGAMAFPPMSIRLDLWRHHAQTHGLLPKEIEGFSSEEVEDHLGFCRAARFRNYYRIIPAKGSKRIEAGGSDAVTTYDFGAKRLRGVKRQSPEMAEHGLQAVAIEYPIKKPEDYALMAGFYEGAGLETREDEFAAFDRLTGDKGLPMLIAGSCPAHEVMLNLCGYERFYLDYYDHPEAVRGLVAAMDAFYRAKLWPALASSSAELILHGNHFSRKMTPLPLFKEFFVPYFTEFNALMRRHGKRVAFHSDADLGELKPLIPTMGFAVADCLATAPLVEEEIEDYFAAWEGKVTCWGGLPSVLFAPEFPVDEFKRRVDLLAAKVAGRNDFIFGASDNVMPGAQWEKLKYLAEACGTWTP